MRNRIEIPKGIYGITGDNFSNGRSNYFCVEEMIKGGIKIVQYRAKTKDTREKVKEAREIRELCRKNGVIFIVNDNVDIALLVDADGVHIGQEDMHPDDVRKLIGDNKIIGLSTHSEKQGMEAYKNPNVDYIGVGPIFPTTTKDTTPVGLGYLEYAVKNLDLPFVAIGGIKAHNIDAIIAKGAQRVCLVSEIVGADSISDMARNLQEKFNK
ncbi:MULTISPECIES: thiamine phosphate synthase [Fusobacterium]|jgi:thiamine-phosphate pyrophosphorylase|uniref:Thiamine-phosphate synthase n=2 Tax=Fusobacterium mortiferum TaxID=850 RepID=A0A414PRT1_FUSMR|nr:MULTISPECIES: thiamine phosphate synthase [Fusobacterium]AVQ19459.1 thiamine phosphate synthase [Fusobacterium mortiferum ATCC 9817]EEO36136.1 thiamine-phosphate diphosphorylase [Fusobacterium mortiferum ATCC 9817]MCF2628607.1 thiamine phosphate synthase [Fusobacterium mortiferum]MCF2698541.1 thiamine phosphate synthase [Fusobacterium mortiferum]MCI7187832.1 thiamine phosphate synthase [Fusobacterium mortiferum]